MPVRHARAASGVAWPMVTGLEWSGDLWCGGESRDLGDGGATHGVEVTGEPLRRGVASLEAHAGYLAALPGHPAPGDMIPRFTAMSGKAMGVEHAVLFRAHDLQAPPEFFTEAMQD